MISRFAATLIVALAPALGAAQPSAELLAAARKDGSVNVYTSNAAPTIQALVADFEKRYGIKVNLWRASSIKVLQRLVAEKQAGRWEFDAASVSGLEIEALYREGLLAEIRSPLRIQARCSTKVRSVWRWTVVNGTRATSAASSTLASKA